MRVVRAGRPVIAGEVTVIPLERLTSHGSGSGRAIRAWIFMEPVGVVVCARNMTWAVDIQGEGIPLDECIRETEGLKEALDGLDSGG